MPTASFYTPINGGPALSGSDPFGNQQQVQPQQPQPERNLAAGPVGLDAQGNPVQTSQGIPHSGPTSVSAGAGAGGALSQPGFGEQVGKLLLPHLLQDGPLSSWLAGNGANGLQQSSAADDYWKGVQGRVGAPRQTQAVLTDYLQNRPDVPTEAGLGPYYDRAKQRAQESIDTAMAARGGLASGYALDQNRNAITDLEAQRANREADFMLRSLAERRAGDTLAGQLAGQADSADIAQLAAGAQLAGQADQGQIGRLSTLGRLLGMGEQFDLARIEGAGNLGAMIQDAEEGRLGGRFNNLLSFGDRTSGITERGADSLIGADQDQVESILSLILGKDREDITQADKDRLQNEGLVATILDAVGVASDAKGAGMI